MCDGLRQWNEGTSVAGLAEAGCVSLQRADKRVVPLGVGLGIDSPEYVRGSCSVA